MVMIVKSYRLYSGCQAKESNSSALLGPDLNPSSLLHASETFKVTAFQGGMDAYRLYSHALAKSTCTSPVPASNHSLNYFASKFNPDTHAYVMSSDGHRFCQGATCKTPINPMTRVCSSDAVPEGRGVSQYVTTQVGPVTLRPGESIMINNLITGWPIRACQEEGNCYMTEFFRFARDEFGELVTYPPVHVHHFNNRPYGYDAPQKLLDFTPFPPGYMPHIKDNTDYPVNALQFHYVKWPHPYGYYRPLHADWSENARLDNVGQTHITITVEFGSRWLRTAEYHSLTPWFDFAFYITGRTPPYLLPEPPQQSFAWRSWRLPCKGSFKHFHFHAHGQIPQAIWVLNTEAQKVLPYPINETAPTTDVALGLQMYGTTLTELQAYVMETAPEAVLCRFVSNGFWKDGIAYALEDGKLNPDCDKLVTSWEFRPDEYLTLLSFIEANTRMGPNFSQHSLLHAKVTFADTSWLY